MNQAAGPLLEKQLFHREINAGLGGPKLAEQTLNIWLISDEVLMAQCGQRGSPSRGPREGGAGQAHTATPSCACLNVTRKIPARC